MSCLTSSASAYGGLPVVGDRRQRAVLAGLSIGILTCVGGLAICPHRAQCLNALTQLDTWMSAGTKIALPLLAASMVIWLARVVSLLVGARRRIRALPVSGAMPLALRASMARIDLQQVICLATDTPTAFCAGALSPRVLVSEGLVRRLGSEELDAVLLHEREHVHRLEPLVRAALDSASEVLFYVPLVRWWSQRRLEDAELRADRAALERLGPRPVAAALWMLGNAIAFKGAAAFGGVARLRVAQVLGDPLPRRAPGWSLVAISAMGTYFAFQVAACLNQVAQHLI
jgi:beta-lactamase regulating signal transducer with metallopeptidase domain